MTLPTDVIEECVLPVQWPLMGAEARAIRRAFSDLADRCAAAAQRRGLDQDDVLLDRMVALRCAGELPGAELWIEPPSVADATTWHAAYERARRAASRPGCVDAEVEVVALGMRVRVEIGAPLWAAAQPDRHLERPPPPE